MALVQGRDGIRGVLARHFADWDPGFDGGIRRRVRMIGRIESGTIHAEWIEREVRGATIRERRGYSDFVVEGGHIHTQREVAHYVSGRQRRRACAAGDSRSRLDGIRNGPSLASARSSFTKAASC